MKTLEQKAKAYDEAIKKAAALYKVSEPMSGCNVIIETLFPELKESEDEKIRKWIIDDIRYNINNEPLNNSEYKKQGERAIAWLEKQGEHKSQRMISAEAKEALFDYENANIQQKDFAPQEDIPRYSIGDVLCDKSCTTLNKESQSNFEITDIRNGMYICDKCSFPISQQDEYELVAKRIEQKPTDKVEPKFHEGEWITDDYDVLQISNVDIENQYYNCVNGNDGDINLTDKAYHLWTIQDAKDGDVLAFDNDTIVIFKDLYNSTTFHSYCHIEDGLFDVSKDDMPDWWEGKGFHPATKEQRDILFEEMHKAGYVWDAEKKELKKVNSYCQETCKGFQETGKCFTDGECKAKKEAEQKLVESEDEKIKKSLIHLVHLYYDGEFEMIDANTSVEKAISWLEKQGNRGIDYSQNHQDSNHPNGCIVLEDFNGGEGFYKLNLDYLNKKQVEEVEEMVRTWNKESKTSNENIKSCIGMCLTDANEQRFNDYNTTLKDCLDWLKKQGEQKPADTVEPKFKVGDLTIRFFTDEFELALGRIIAFWNQNHKDGKYDENELMSYIKVRETELVKLFTDNVCKVSLSDCSEEYRKAYYDGYNKCNRDWLKIKDISVDEYNKNAEILLGGQVEQKPSDEDMKILLRTEYEKGRADAIAEIQKRWSEEDELQMQAIIDLLPGLTIRHNWLKSLKGRVQPKQEWSEEDSVKLQRIIDFLWYNRKGDTDAIYQQEQDIDWLKSLRPQKRWKPSDGQILFLQAMVNDPNNASSESCQIVLKDILEKLKKLKKEKV